MVGYIPGYAARRTIWDEPHASPLVPHIPPFRPRQGRIKAGTFDVLAYPWTTRNGRTSTAPLTELPAGHTTVNGTLSDVVTQRSPDDRVNLSGAEDALVQSRVYSMIAAGTAIIEDCTITTTEETTAAVNGPVTMRRCIVAPNGDGWRSIVESGDARAHAEYVYFYRPPARFRLPDGSITDNHHDALQSWAATGGYTIRRCLLVGFTTALINSTPETAPVRNVVIEECFIESTHTTPPLRFALSKFEGCDPDQERDDALGIGPGWTSYVTIRDILVGRLKTPDQAVLEGSGPVFTSEAVRDAAIAAGVSAIVMADAKDPRTNATLRDPDDNSPIQVETILMPAKCWPVASNIVHAGEYSDGTPDPDHMAGEPANLGSRRIVSAWPPPEAEETWWTTRDPYYARSKRSVTLAPFALNESREYVIEWGTTMATPDYDVRIGLSSYAGGALFPEVIAKTATTATIRVTADTAATTDTRTLTTRAFEAR